MATSADSSNHDMQDPIGEDFIFQLLLNASLWEKSQLIETLKEHNAIIRQDVTRIEEEKHDPESLKLLRPHLEKAEAVCAEVERSPTEDVHEEEEQKKKLTDVLQDRMQLLAALKRQDHNDVLKQEPVGVASAARKDNLKSTPKFSSGPLAGPVHGELGDRDVAGDIDTTVSQEVKPQQPRVEGRNPILNQLPMILGLLQQTMLAQRNAKYPDTTETSQTEEEPVWLKCMCSRPLCSSCKAERMAIVHSGAVDTSKAGNRDSECLRSVFYRNIRNTMQAVYKVYYFHTQISDTTFGGQECAASPCALATLLFAKYFLEKPHKLTEHDVPDPVYHQVVGAIQEAISVYQKTYGNKPVTLDPTEASATLKEYGPFTVIVDEVCDCISAQNLVHHIQELQLNEALIIKLDTPYKVMSIVHTRNGQGIVVFNPQKGPWENDTIYKGAFLLWCRKSSNTLSDLRSELVQCSGIPLNFGKCKFTVIKLVE